MNSLNLNTEGGRSARRERTTGRLANHVDDAAARACYGAAVVLGGAVFALMSINREFERVVQNDSRTSHALKALASFIELANAMEAEAAGEYEFITGKRPPMLAPY